MHIAAICYAEEMLEVNIEIIYLLKWEARALGTEAPVHLSPPQFLGAAGWSGWYFKSIAFFFFFFKLMNWICRVIDVRVIICTSSIHSPGLYCLSLLCAVFFSPFLSFFFFNNHPVPSWFYLGYCVLTGANTRGKEYVSLVIIPL